MNLKEELATLKQAIKNTRFTRLSKEHIIKEFVTNGVAGIVSILVSALVHNFFIPNDWKDLSNAKELIKHGWRTRVKKEDDHIIVLDSTTYEILNWTILFLVGLIVFTFVENLMENYLELRKNKKS